LSSEAAATASSATSSSVSASTIADVITQRSYVRYYHFLRPSRGFS
jgi:hypothetical protein